MWVAGAIGIEAVSRGCSEAHFVELDPWVCRSILEPNLEAAEVDDQATVHTMVCLLGLRAHARRLSRLSYDFPPYWSYH